ncbi:outer membrane protein assembly factor BamD [Arenimonas fontis]|uniref:Outer membrane protein assembly factor BamD n=1 Tax=Arenimonas fontis TaxID=2608255 RepID=A0A5B2ZCK0_9GAMM|nr:outer membrane protein assembly factor BamD [Arenimonas fontis]KAA2284914.1 outer membrane protein assembly factor BamD [Arenimonas fontis]
MTRIQQATRFALILLLVAGLAGCKTISGWFGGDKEDPTETLPVEQMYAEAHASMSGGNFNRAAQYYQRLVARFPYGPYTEQAQLELAYSQYKLNRPEEATATIDRFIRTYPTHRHIDYAYYLKALVNFERGSGMLLRMARQDLASRDLGATQQSLNDFAEVVRRYPNSRYAPDARQRMIFLRNRLARYELKVGLYYLRRGAWLAAANRGKYILQQYPQSEHEGDALALMAEAYTRLGQGPLADDARQVLQLNYPEHPYLAGNWPEGRGLLGKLNPFGSK